MKLPYDLIMLYTVMLSNTRERVGIEQDHNQIDIKTTWKGKEEAERFTHSFKIEGNRLRIVRSIGYEHLVCK